MASEARRSNLCPGSNLRGISKSEFVTCEALCASGRHDAQLPHQHPFDTSQLPIRNAHYPTLLETWLVVNAMRT